jgi:hypothetical protein
MTRISISDLQNQSAQSLLSLLKDEKIGGRWFLSPWSEEGQIWVY